MNANYRFIWLLGYLLAYLAGAGALMVVNTTVLGLGDPKFGAGGWLIYWPVWGVMFLPPIFVASFVAEKWWGTRRVLLRFFGLTLATYLVAMEISFLNDIQLPTLAIELLILATLTVLLGRAWLRRV